jgi:hypothetical protein
LRPWNDDCDPSWSEDELRRKVREAREKGTEPVGHLIPEPRACRASSKPPAAGAYPTNGQAQTTTAAGDPWPDPPGPAAYHGPAGELVRLIEPHTEADPVALLTQFLVAFGNCLGRLPHFIIEATAHYLNLFAVLVGDSSKSRKGTSWNYILMAFRLLTEAWARDHISSGLDSGQGLIWAVRDPIWKRERVGGRGEPARYEEVEDDAGIQDKRLLCYESEFASVLKNMDRTGNILSPVLRQAYDTGDLNQIIKNPKAARATGAHVSIIGHVTATEVCRYLSATEQANGFGNRFLWVAVRRSKCLPEGGSLDPHALDGVLQTIGQALAFGRQVGRIDFDADARELWHEEYEALSEGKPGPSGRMLARGEAHARRLACLYALLDRSAVVRHEHLKAALALWQHCERTVYFVFGDSLGDPTADEILAALRAAPDGLSRNDIRQMFSKHKKSEETGRALGLLLTARKAYFRKIATGGRDEERWYVGPAPKAP